MSRTSTTPPLLTPHHAPNPQPSPVIPELNAPSAPGHHYPVFQNPNAPSDYPVYPSHSLYPTVESPLTPPSPLVHEDGRLFPAPSEQHPRQSVSADYTGDPEGAYPSTPHMYSGITIPPPPMNTPFYPLAPSTLSQANLTHSPQHRSPHNPPTFENGGPLDTAQPSTSGNYPNPDVPTNYPIYPLHLPYTAAPFTPPNPSVFENGGAPPGIPPRVAPLQQHSWQGVPEAVSPNDNSTHAATRNAAWYRPPQSYGPPLGMAYVPPAFSAQPPYPGYGAGVGWSSEPPRYVGWGPVSTFQPPVTASSNIITAAATTPWNRPAEQTSMPMPLDIKTLTEVGSFASKNPYRLRKVNRRKESLLETEQLASQEPHNSNQHSSHAPHIPSNSTTTSGFPLQAPAQPHFPDHDAPSHSPALPSQPGPEHSRISSDDGVEAAAKTTEDGQKQTTSDSFIDVENHPFHNSLSTGGFWPQVGNFFTSPFAGGRQNVENIPEFDQRLLVEMVLSQMYFHILLRLPSLYFSRVARIFDAARLNIFEITEMALQTTEAVQGTSEKHGNFYVTQPNAPTIPPQYEKLKASWESFVDALMREWETFNVISVLLLTAILTILQIGSAASDPITRSAVLFSLICAIVSLLLGCMYIIRFSTMRKTYAAAEWAKAALQTSESNIWNVWVLLALPVVWLSWSIIFFMVAIMSFVWRTGSDNQNIYNLVLSPKADLAVHIVMSVVLVLGLVNTILVTHTFQHYGEALDIPWNMWINEWKKAKENEKLNYQTNFSDMLVNHWPPAAYYNSYPGAGYPFMPQAPPGPIIPPWINTPNMLRTPNTPFIPPSPSAGGPPDGPPHAAPSRQHLRQGVSADYTGYPGSAYKFTPQPHMGVPHSTPRFYPQHPLQPDPWFAQQKQHAHHPAHNPYGQAVPEPPSHFIDSMNPFAEGNDYGPVLDPLLVKAVQAEVKMHPLILPRTKNDDQAYLRWNMLFTTSTVMRSDDPYYVSWAKERNAPATFPRLTSLQVVGRYFPWIIEVKAKDKDRGVTCGEVIDAIGEDFQRLLRKRDYENLPPRDKSEVVHAYKYNRSPVAGVPGGILGQGMKRLDFLRRHTTFGGIERNDEFVKQVCGDALPCVFVLNCLIVTTMDAQEQARMQHAQSPRSRASSVNVRISVQSPSTSSMTDYSDND